MDKVGIMASLQELLWVLGVDRIEKNISQELTIQNGSVCTYPMPHSAGWKSLAILNAIKLSGTSSYCQQIM